MNIKPLLKKGLYVTLAGFVITTYAFAQSSIKGIASKKQTIIEPSAQYSLPGQLESYSFDT